MSTKDLILDAAEILILQKGVSATSLNDICNLAKTSKGALFHYFKSKNDLIIESIIRFSEHSLTKYKNLVSSSNGDAVKILEIFFAKFEAEIFANDLVGCVVGISAQELAVNNPELQQVIIQAFSPMLDFFSELVECAAQQQRVNINAHELSLMWLACSQGALMLYRGLGDKQIAIAALVQYRTCLFQKLNISPMTN
jgi:TetR/AcrR family transcriptional repressor of nem operon